MLGIVLFAFVVLGASSGTDCPVFMVTLAGTNLFCAETDR